jgi:phosphohistidine phosphatase SixA
MPSSFTEMPHASVDRPSSRIMASLLIGFLAVAAGARADTLTGRELVAALRSGGYVIVMRHARSPSAPPDANSANPDNPTHERQLDEAGRASAREMGEALRRLRIRIGRVLSSPTYRALETIRLGQFGSPQTYPQLGDAGHSMQADASGQRGAWLRKRVSTVPMRGANTLIVTHLPNIAEAFPQEAQGLGEGEALIFRPDGKGTVTFIARVKIDEWSRWVGLH